MLIVAGTFHVDPARRDDFVRGRADAMAASRAEPGCLEYVFAADPIDETRVVLFERWEDQAALDAHLVALRERRAASPAAPATPPVPVVSSEILKYEISSVGPLG
jgi:quinol monooxygenase YgiN